MGSAVDDIDFDDLTSPRLTDVQRQILEFTEAKPVDLDIDRMLAEAIEHAGLPGADLDDTHGFVDRLHVHVAAIEATTGCASSPGGRCGNAWCGCCATGCR